MLSLGAKILLLTYDGEREMVERTNEAYRANLSSEEAESPLLVLNIRRDHLVADSLQQVRTCGMTLGIGYRADSFVE